MSTPPAQRIEPHRIQLMLREDPANAIGSVRAYFMQHMQQLSARIGPQAMQQLLATCDPLVWQHMQQP